MLNNLSTLYEINNSNSFSLPKIIKRGRFNDNTNNYKISQGNSDRVKSTEKIMKKRDKSVDNKNIKMKTKNIIVHKIETKTIDLLKIQKLISDKGNLKRKKIFRYVEI